MTEPIAARRASFGPTLALTVTLAIACFAVVLAVVLLFIHPKPVAGFGTQQNQRAESLLYAIAFAVILPLALVLVPRVADRIAVGPNADALALLSALLAATLAGGLLLSCVLPGGGGVVEALVVIGAWTLAAVAVLARALRPRPWHPLLRAGASWPHA
ncbi:MAG TPA: hypothetical protein VE662_06520, partial [Solirubrobacterales bacterium]|nr:hypothetical protein [Solirubrobacterales bacterium]